MTHFLHWARHLYSYSYIVTGRGQSGEQQRGIALDNGRIVGWCRAVFSRKCLKTKRNVTKLFARRRIVIRIKIVFSWCVNSRLEPVIIGFSRRPNKRTVPRGALVHPRRARHSTSAEFLSQWYVRFVFNFISWLHITRHQSTDSLQLLSMCSLRQRDNEPSRTGVGNE